MESGTSWKGQNACSSSTDIKNNPSPTPRLQNIMQLEALYSNKSKFRNPEML